MVLASELSLDAVLLRIVELAVDLTDAGYGALGVLTPDGRLIEEFITVGISPEERAVLGEPPTGHGLLGALITEAHPLRIPDISAEALFASIMAGASGYVLKQVRSGELVHAIRAVGAGDSLLDPAVTTAVLDRLRKGKHLMRDEKLARLSPQEERILTLIAEGRTNKEIGEELTLAEKTVKNYVSSILSKLEVARRAEAAAYLARHTTMPGSVG